MRCASVTVIFGSVLLFLLTTTIGKISPAAEPVPIESTPVETPPKPPITDEAQRVYESFGDAIYQVQVIDLASGKKNSIGTGFQFTHDGLLATNYHVIAEMLQRPQANRLEFLHDKGERGKLKILIADVTHDLAILRMDKPGKTFVELGQSKLPKGVKLFSLGNPHDIGFTIVEGTYNGYSRETLIDKIHFSGAINPGMSGGPALDHNGRVVGINVQTGGNQIGFLVPVEPLRLLLVDYLKQPEDYDFTALSKKNIEQQLVSSQKKNIDRLLTAPWESVSFGGFMVPGRIHPAFKCWGGPAHEEKDPWLHFYSTCSNEDQLFLDSDLTSGIYSFGYGDLTGKDKINLPRFYSYYQSQYGALNTPWQKVSESEVTNFACNNRFVDMAGQRWKASFCLRRYIKYPALYDTQVFIAAVGSEKKGTFITLQLQGVTKENALQFTDRFLHEIRPPAEPLLAAVSGGGR